MPRRKATRPARNPSGKGGFTENPENRHKGGFSPEHSVSFNYRKFLSLPERDFEKWLKEHPERTLAQSLAHKAAKRARKELPYLKEVTDRTEGKPAQAVDVTSKGQELTVSFVSVE